MLHPVFEPLPGGFVAHELVVGEEAATIGGCYSFLLSSKIFLPDAGPKFFLPGQKFPTWSKKFPPIWEKVIPQSRRIFLPGGRGGGSPGASRRISYLGPSFPTNLGDTATNKKNYMLSAHVEWLDVDNDRIQDRPNNQTRYHCVRHIIMNTNIGMGGGSYWILFRSSGDCKTEGENKCGSCVSERRLLL